jgi:hypothetical protein
VALIISQNVNRRHQTKGSVAVAVAMEFSEPAKVGRGKKGPETGPIAMVDKQRLSEARLVVKYTPALAEEVLAGQMGLDKAYDEARKAKADYRDPASQRRRSAISKQSTSCLWSMVEAIRGDAPATATSMSACNRSSHAAGATPLRFAAASARRAPLRGLRPT